jgi:CSLREA domain-containing protein
MLSANFFGIVRVGERARAPIFALLAALATLLVGLLVAEPARAVGTFVVNRTGDESEPVANRGDGLCDADPATAGDQCSLRAAIQEANALANSGGPDVINFNIPGDKKKVKTVKPTSELPIIGDNADNTNDQAVIIDGYTQPGSKKNTRATGAINAVPKIQIDGTTAGIDADGLIIGGTAT